MRGIKILLLAVGNQWTVIINIYPSIKVSIWLNVSRCQFRYI